MREINTGTVIRIVAITERDAELMNSMTENHGFEYVLVQEKPKAKVEPETVEQKKTLRVSRKNRK